MSGRSLRQGGSPSGTPARLSTTLRSGSPRRASGGRCRRRRRRNPPPSPSRRRDMCGETITFSMSQQRAVGGERLLLEHVERRAGDAPYASASTSAGSTTVFPRPTLTNRRRRLHRAERRRIERVPGLRRQRHRVDHVVGIRHGRVQVVDATDRVEHVVARSRGAPDRRVTRMPSPSRSARPIDTARSVPDQPRRARLPASRSPCRASSHTWARCRSNIGRNPFARATANPTTVSVIGASSGSARVREDHVALHERREQQGVDADVGRLRPTRASARAATRLLGPRARPTTCRRSSASSIARSSDARSGANRRLDVVRDGLDPGRRLVGRRAHARRPRGARAHRAHLIHRGFRLGEPAVLARGSRRPRPPPAASRGRRGVPLTLARGSPRGRSRVAQDDPPRRQIVQLRPSTSLATEPVAARDASAVGRDGLGDALAGPDHGRGARRRSARQPLPELGRARRSPPRA